MANMHTLTDRMATSDIASDPGRFSPQYGIVVDVLMPSDTSRMGDFSEDSKFTTRTYFQESKVAPLVLEQASGKCKVSLEGFASSAGRVARIDS